LRDGIGLALCKGMKALTSLSNWKVLFTLILSLLAPAANVFAATGAEIADTLKYVRANAQDFANDGSAEYIAESLIHFLEENRFGSIQFRPLYEEGDYRDTLRALDKARLEKSSPKLKIIRESLLNSIQSFQRNQAVQPSSKYGQLRVNAPVFSPQSGVTQAYAPPARVSLHASAAVFVPSETKKPSLHATAPAFVPQNNKSLSVAAPIFVPQSHASLRVSAPAFVPKETHPAAPAVAPPVRDTYLTTRASLAVECKRPAVAPSVSIPAPFNKLDPHGFDFEWDAAWLPEEE